MTYRVNEVFYSLQGEGARAGEPSVFVRFSGCNLTCSMATHGFDCDTEFVSGRSVDSGDLMEWIDSVVGGNCSWVVLTGGEPLLQVDEELLDALQRWGKRVAIETNGTHAIPDRIEWVTVSPKVAEHVLKPTEAEEVKYVRSYGQGIPKPKIKAKYKYISPAFSGDGTLDPKTLKWCIDLVKDNPDWRLTCQNHKLWTVR